MHRWSHCIGIFWRIWYNRFVSLFESSLPSKTHWDCGLGAQYRATCACANSNWFQCRWFTFSLHSVSYPGLWHHSIVHLNNISLTALEVQLNLENKFSWHECISLSHWVLVWVRWVNLNWVHLGLNWVYSTLQGCVGVNLNGFHSRWFSSPGSL